MSLVTKILSACFLLSVLFTVASGQSNLTAKANVPPPAVVDGSSSESDRARDGLIVRYVAFALRSSRFQPSPENLSKTASTLCWKQPSTI